MAYIQNEKMVLFTVLGEVPFFFINFEKGPIAQKKPTKSKRKFTVEERTSPSPFQKQNDE